jgi:hypothetical protein
VARLWKIRVQQNLWNRELKRPLGIPEPRWQGNIEISFEEIECNCMSWICLVQEGSRSWSFWTQVWKLFNCYKSICSTRLVSSMVARIMSVVKAVRSCLLARIQCAVWKYQFMLKQMKGYFPDITGRFNHLHTCVIPVLAEPTVAGSSTRVS